MARFVPNRRLDDELQREVRYQAALLEAAKDAEGFAKQIAKAEAYDTGDYHDSIEATVVGQEVVLQAKDWKAWWIEKGSIHNSPSAPLRRGAQDSGLKFKAGE